MQSLSAKKYSTVISTYLPLLLCVTALLSSIGHARADNYQDAQRLFKQGEASAALAKVEAHLVAKPNDAQARFLKGVILSEQQKTAEAIRVFTSLTEDHPELPEPYNNLAVLYASQAQYDKARNALEMAIRTHPSYAVAHENLGDIYAAMASQAYDKALKLDIANNTVKAKLSLIKEIFTPAPATKGPTKVEASPASTALAAARKESEFAKEVTAKTPVLSTTQAAAAKSSTEEEVLQALRGWAKAWSNRDVTSYLAFYATDFKTPGGEARAEWESTRRERITRPSRIEVEVSAPQVTVDASGQRAMATFRQSYRSDTLKSSGTKTLSWIKNDNRWLIVDERVGN